MTLVPTLDYSLSLRYRYRYALHQSPGSGNPTKGAPSPSTIKSKFADSNRAQLVVCLTFLPSVIEC
ncbi:MAG: hypothetical protein ACHBN1_36400 [Heteroscytonema crispum UTEX LB 1556]